MECTYSLSELKVSDSRFCQETGFTLATIAYGMKLHYDLDGLRYCRPSQVAQTTEERFALCMAGRGYLLKSFNSKRIVMAWGYFDGDDFNEYGTTECRLDGSHITVDDEDEDW